MEEIREIMNSSMKRDIDRIVFREVWNFNLFQMACLFKDRCLINYKYDPRALNDRCVVHKWQHRTLTTYLTTDMVRVFLTNDIGELLIQILNNLIIEVAEPEKNPRVKKITEMCIKIYEGELYKEFINCYNKGYFVE